jgi:cell division protein FtsB
MITKRTWQTIATVMGACLVGYFLYHTVEGDRGWLALLRLEDQVNVAQENLSQLQQVHKELGHRVQLIRPGSLDPDLLDEKSREMLNYSKPNEIIVIVPSDQQDAASAMVQRNKQ